MKTTAEIAEKIRAFSLELAAELGEISREEHGSPFAALEVLAAEVGDQLSCEILTQQSRMKNEMRLPEAECCCPKCNGPSDLKRLRQREVQTIRGTTEVTEPEYHCKQCRRSFFPSDTLDRSGT
jgi:uncharacterized protein YbaR (Trm112 family)